MSWWLALCLLLVAALAVPMGRAKTGDFFAPVALFVASWCGTLGLYFLRLLPYRPMNVSTFALLVATIVVVAIGGAFGQRLAAQRHGPEGARHVVAPDVWVAAYSVIGLLGVAWYVSLVARILGWSAFQAGGPIRAALGVYTIPSGFLFFEYFCIAAPLLAFALLMSGTRLRPIVLVGPVLCALATWLTTDRTQFFVLTLGALFIFVFQRGQGLSWRGMTAAGMLCAVLLVSNFLIVGAWMGKTPANLGVAIQLSSRTDSTADHRPAGTTPSETAGLVDVTPLERIDRVIGRASTLYLYATASFAALDVLLEEKMEQSGGVHTVYPVARLLERTGLIEGPLPRAIPADRPLRLRSDRDIAFNGYTFLYYPLMDFGRFGALVYTAVVGVLSGWVYGLARSRRDSPLYLLLLAHLSTALVLSVFVNKFNNTASWYVALVTVLPFLLAPVRRRESARGA